MRLLTTLLAALLLAACSGGSNLKPLDQPVPLEKLQAQREVRMIWSVRIGDGTGTQYLKLAPLVTGDTVYAADRYGRISALKRDSGDPRWQVDLAQPVSGGVGDGDELLLLGSGANVMALDKQDGKLRWKAEVSSEVLSSPVRSGKVVVARSVDGTVVGLSADDGKLLWRFKRDVPLLSLRGTGQPTIVGSSVMVGFANGQIAAIGVDDGRLRWEATVAEPQGRTELERMVDVDSNILERDGIVLAAAYQGRLAALGVGNGNLLWAREMSVDSGLAQAGRDVYVTDSRGDVWALERNSGGTLWKQTRLHGRRLSAPVVQGETLVVGDFQGYLHWLSREDGHLMARAQVGDAWPNLGGGSGFTTGYKDKRAVLATPVVSGDWVYAQDMRGYLSAFRVTKVNN